MESPELSFTLAYVVLSFCFVFTPNEFRSAGLTIQNLFSSWLGSEDVGFIQYHIRRTSITIVVHSALPLGKLVTVTQVEEHSVPRNHVTHTAGVRTSVTIITFWNHG